MNKQIIKIHFKHVALLNEIAEKITFISIELGSLMEKLQKEIEEYKILDKKGEILK